MCRNGAQKLLGVLITIGEAVAYVVSGMYGDVRELGAGNAILIILQVVQQCLVELDSLSERAKVESSLFWALYHCKCPRPMKLRLIVSLSTECA